MAVQQVRMLHTFVARQAATTPQRAKSTLQRAELTLQQVTPADTPIIASLGNLAALVFLTMTTKPTFRADFKLGDGGTKDRDRAPSSRPARHGRSATRSTLERREKKRPWSTVATATVAAQYSAARERPVPFH